MNREPVRISITLEGGEVFNILTEGVDFGSDFDKLIANHDFHSLMERNVRAAIEAANRRNPHPAVTLVGGLIPAHIPGAYPWLSCCGGDKLVVEQMGQHFGVDA